MIYILKEYKLGDMIARYVTDDKKETVGLFLLPADLPCPVNPKKQMALEPLVQLKAAGDIYDEAYALGNSMRNSETVRRLKLQEQTVSQEEEKLTVLTRLGDSRGYGVWHRLVWKTGMPYVRITTGFENRSKETAALEMLESFSMFGLSPYLEGDGYDQIELYRLRSVWSQEGKLECIPLEELQLEPAWDPHAVRCEKYGQAGSMPVNKFFPFISIKDKKNQVFWGAQIAHPASWQIELYRKDEGVSVSGGLADRDFGHWLKHILPGESFESPEAIVSVCHTDSIDLFTERLTAAGQEAAEAGPESEQDLPVLFNEYCTTWGCPSHENISRILKAVEGKGFSYFVIDCGWYKADGIPWDISMGDYQVSETLFPQGLKAVTEEIRKAGMIPGIWFEIENVGSAAEAYQDIPHLLKKDGHVLTSYFRRFWDMRDPWVERYLSEKVIELLRNYGFGYMKIDYNETIGIGCDGAESLGEGLRQNMQAATGFIGKVKKEIPQIVLENCSSGGHRLEPGLMGATSMASFSDAHECLEIPIIAANLHRAILPRQSQIWAVIRKDDTGKRIAYSIASTFLGRMCISGDVTELTKDQWKVIEDGIRFYKEIAPVIKYGQSYRYGNEIKSMRHPKGWQAVVRTGADKDAYAVIHTFGEKVPEVIEISLPEKCALKIQGIYSWGKEELTIEGRILKYKPRDTFTAVAVRLSEK